MSPANVREGTYTELCMRDGEVVTKKGWQERTVPQWQMVVPSASKEKRDYDSLESTQLAATSDDRHANNSIVCQMCGL